LKTFEIFIELNKMFIYRRSTQPRRTTHRWFIELDFQRDLLKNECCEDMSEAIQPRTSAFPVQRARTYSKLVLRITATQEHRRVCESALVDWERNMRLLRKA